MTYSCEVQRSVIKPYSHLFPQANAELVRYEETNVANMCTPRRF